MHVSIEPKEKICSEKLSEKKTEKLLNTGAEILQKKLHFASIFL